MPYAPEYIYRYSYSPYGYNWIRFYDIPGRGFIGWPFYYPYSGFYPPFPHYDGQLLSTSQLSLHKAVTGTATWTDGGATTKCGIPWSSNNYMTAAVSSSSPYKCGEKLRIKNLSVASLPEIQVTVVDTVQNFPVNKINLHKNAFVALGSPASVGVIDVEIMPIHQRKRRDYAMWGKLLMELTHKAYPGYKIVDYKYIGSEEIAKDKVKEVFEYSLKDKNKTIKVRTVVLFNPLTERAISINFEELQPSS